MSRRSDGAFNDDELAAFLLGVWVSCRSSNVKEARYDAENETMEVGFLGKGGRPDSYYAYPEVDHDLAVKFALTPSKGGDGIWDLFRYPGRPFVRYTF